MSIPKVELLAPAGSPEALDAAVGEGADAVYLGLRSFNARMRSANFSYAQFEGALRGLHRKGKKIYVTVNTVFEQREADRVYQLLKYLSSLGPDGVIIQDLGAAAMARDCFPSLKLHASTQMNISSARGVNLLSKHGVSRVVLARELSIGDIKKIRENTNAELEVFVHGALCVSVSGACLFSSYLGGKSANRGMCTQACRRIYSADDKQGYYFSPSDLQLMEFIPGLVDAGVRSFKIEGRMKSAEYAGTVVSAYRRVIDGLGGDYEKAVAEGIAILKNDFARSKTSFNAGAGLSETWLKPDQAGGTGIPLGLILRTRGSGARRQGLIGQGPVVAEGDSIRLHRADDSDRRSYKADHVEEDRDGAAWVSIPEGFETGDAAYLIQTKSMSRRYAPVMPRDLSEFRRAPGRDRAPLPVLPVSKAAAPKHPAPKTRASKDSAFPEGIYAGVSFIDDLYILQSERPIRVLLEFNAHNAAALLKEKAGPLPFSPGEIILALSPVFSPSGEELLAESVPALIGRGYRQFMVNNLGEISYFRDMDARLIAGPYLYMFNRWAYKLLAGLGLSAAVSPLENNRQNLEKTISREVRRNIFVTVFAYPALFRIPFDLSGLYDFGSFFDSRGEPFALKTGPEGSLVLPETPFSIVDKIPFLKEAGFKRHILDFSGRRLKKRDYKDIMDAVKNGRPLPNVSRFNWKDGFFNPEEAGPPKSN